MTVPNVIGAAAGVSPEVTASILAGPAVTATDASNPQPQQIVATVIDPPAVQPPEPVTSADTIERIRQQEREKLHTAMGQRDDQLKAMAAELDVLRQEREARAAAEQKAQEAAAEAERLKKIAETSAKDLVLQQQTEWEQKFAALQAEREAERAALAKEAEFNNLRAYIQQRVRESSDEIAPQLIDYVTGNTPEEVDASIATAKAKTAEILHQVSEAQTQQRANMRGVSATSFPGAGPDELSGAKRELTAQQLRDMPLAEFAKYRQQLGVTGNSTNKNRGLFD